jgi:hypothetical protein
VRESKHFLWHRSFFEPRRGAQGIVDDTRAKTEGQREELRHAEGCPSSRLCVQADLFLLSAERIVAHAFVKDCGRSITTN